MSAVLQTFLRTQGYYRAPDLVAERQRGQALALLPRPREPEQSERYELEARPAINYLLSLDPILRLVRAVLGDSGVAVLNRHNHVIADRGGSSRGGRMHRDVLHWSRSPVTALILLEADAGDPRSWPSLVPGSHLWPIDGPSNGGGYWLDEAESDRLSSQQLRMPLKPGDVLLMDSMLYHAAGAGRPDSARVMATVCIRPVDELTGVAAENERLLFGERGYAGQGWWRRDD